MSTSNCPKCDTSLTKGDECPNCTELKIDFEFVPCCLPLSKPNTNTKSNLSESISSIQKEGRGKDGKR